LFFGCRKQNNSAETTQIIVARSLGLAYLEESKLSAAESQFRQQIDLAPQEPSGYANLAVTYLRMEKYDAAEEQLKKALALDPENADIRLVLAKIYELKGQRSRAADVLTATLQSSPGHARTLYALAELYTNRNNPEARKHRTKYLQQVVTAAPANLAVRVQLIAALLRNGQSDLAAMHLEALRRQMPDLPDESEDFLDKALAFARAAQPEKATTAMSILHNYLKITPLYRAGIIALKGPGGRLVGFPILSLDRIAPAESVKQKSILAALRFADVTASTGLDTSVVQTYPTDSLSPVEWSLDLADYDRDGDEDLYLARWFPGEPGGRPFLFRNDEGHFTDVADLSGVTHRSRETSATFADSDNDGYLDLYVVNRGRNVLYHNDGAGMFQDVTSETGVGDGGPGLAVLVADFDHEGDLDIYLANRGRNRLYRNNSNGTFTEAARKMGIAGGESVSPDAAFGDFDDDGDLDLFVANTSSNSVLYSNLRQGHFQDVTTASGLTTAVGTRAVAVGDYNNDGFPDLFVTGLSNKSHILYRNRGNGTFEKDASALAGVSDLRMLQGYDAAFLDFDNDGYLDLLVGGQPGEKSGVALVLLHNDGAGKYQEVSSLLPENTRPVRKIAFSDYDNDGDVDLFLGDFRGTIRLLRNDGGNANHYLRVHLTGLRKGSSKNNYYGIGARLEVRAGELYQSRVVSDPVTYLGLGQHSRADVVRTVWSNGVPQNSFFPDSDQDLVEEQILKGSCAFLYTWNGEKYTFVKDLMWRSALGMPLGIMGGETAYAFPDASKEYLKIPGEVLQDRDGVYTLQITEELWETAFFDQVQLIVVDHPDSIDIYVDEKFVPPPFPALKLHSVSNPLPPRSARDETGADLLPMIRAKDDVYAANLRAAKYQGITELHDLILDPGGLSQDDTIVMFLNGWLFPTDASINVAVSQSQRTGSVAPYLQVINRRGEWQTVIENMGFPMGKDKTVVVDLTGKFLSQDLRVRIRTSMEIYWDHIFFAPPIAGGEKRKSIAALRGADLHYHGFSRLYRKGGRYGPHWFDYSDVSKTKKWRDLVGNYTRYGEVSALLSQADDQYVIMNSGDEVTLEFDAAGVPPLPPGWSRDYFIYTVGWIKDGDLNTAHGKTVLPLPFHRMSSYPYGPSETYPDSPALREYLKTYNTRKVTADLPRL